MANNSNTVNVPRLDEYILSSIKSVLSKSRLIIISSRISARKGLKTINSDFFTKEEELNFDEVQQKTLIKDGNNKMIMQNSINTIKQLKNTNELISEDNNDKSPNSALCIEIYFTRKNSNIKVLIERWNIETVFENDKGTNNNSIMRQSNISNSFFYQSYSTQKKTRKIFILKKLSTFIRTLYCYSRSLPAFTLCNNNSFNYILDYKIYYSDQNLSKVFESKSNFEKELNGEFLKKRKVFTNTCDINVGKINLNIEYLLKNDIFVSEEEIKIRLQNHKLSTINKGSIEFKNNSHIFLTSNHHRHHSGQASNKKFEMINMKKSTLYGEVSIDFTNDEKNMKAVPQHPDLELKRVNSKSLDKLETNDKNKNREDESDNDSSFSLQIDSSDNEFNIPIKRQENSVEKLFSYQLDSEKKEIFWLNIKLKLEIPHDSSWILFENIENEYLNNIILNNNIFKRIYNEDISPCDNNLSIYDEDEYNENIFHCSEEILEISDESSFFSKEEANQNWSCNKNHFESCSVLETLILKVYSLKMSLLRFPTIQLNILKLFKCVHKN